MNKYSDLGEEILALTAKAPKFLAFAFPFVLGMFRGCLDTVLCDYMQRDGSGKAK
jgi:hypothetical protein